MYKVWYETYIVKYPSIKNHPNCFFTKLRQSLLVKTAANVLKQCFKPWTNTPIKSLQNMVFEKAWSTTANG